MRLEKELEKKLEEKLDKKLDFFMNDLRLASYKTFLIIFRTNYIFISLIITYFS